jgi:3-hydroxybutyryl-CoA dehydrogenase
MEHSVREPSAPEFRAVAVVGLGTMGAGLAEVFARAGLQVVAIEADPAALDRGLAILDASLARAVSRGRLDASEQAAIRGRVRPAGGFAEAAGVDLAIEAVPEQLATKRQVFAELDRACRPDAILATNTSSLSVTAIAAATRHPGRVVGMHFFNPAPVMRLVEVVTTVLADPGTQAAVADLATRLGKTPVQVTDRAGFVANALLLPYLNHAVGLLETGFASREDIDAAATAGLGLPMGPLALLDLIGLDTSLSIMEVLRAEFGGRRHTPAPLLRRLVAAGRLGRKSGRGIYEYPPPGSGPPASSEIRNVAASVPVTVTLTGPGRSKGTASAAAVGPDGKPTAAPAGAAGPTAAPAGPDEGPAGAGLAVALAKAGITVVGAAEPSDLVIAEIFSSVDPLLPAALASGRPGDVVGLHVCGPDGGLAELVSTVATTPAALAAGRALAGALGLAAVAAPDRPGFLVGTLLYPHLADAVRMVQDGYATAADVDTAMTLGCGYPHGPLELLDETGADRVRAALAAMHQAGGDPALAPPPLLAAHAAAGLGFRR